MILKGKFTSEWEDGNVTTDCTLDTETGELNADSVDVSDLGCLFREIFTDSLNNEYPVCNYCHTFIMKTAIVDDQVGKGIHEERICTNEFCDSHFDDSFFENLP
jgi:hypothetical protein